MTDQRPDPKPRKLIKLWQAYLFFYEIMEWRKRHLLRISAVKKKKSNMDALFEQDMMEYFGIDANLSKAKNKMVKYGQETAGPIWNWVTGIRGLGEGGLAAQLLAQIDDINLSPTVASLWRFAGFATIDGKAEKNEKGIKSKFNRKLKGVCFNIADQFIKQQTPGYVDIYYAEKYRLRTLHPEPLCIDCNQPAQVYQKKDSKTGELINAYRCPLRKKDHTVKYSDAHLHNRAWRKMIKAFLRDLWAEWRRCEGALPAEATVEWDQVVTQEEAQKLALNPEKLQFLEAQLNLLELVNKMA